MKSSFSAAFLAITMLLSISLQADLIRDKYVKMMPASSKSKENGGLLDTKTAATDGVGFIIVDDGFDNSVYNNLSSKYSVTAGTNLIDYILTSPDTTAEEKALALTLIPVQVDGTVCDDGDAATTGDVYTNGVCSGTAGTTCLGAPIGSTVGGLLVVDDTTIRIHARTSTPICTSNVTSIAELFVGYSGSEFSNIEDWDTSNVTNMYYVFDSNSFNRDISRWNTSKVTDMSWMFYGVADFNQPIGSWNTSNVVYLSGMFNYASAFNQPIGSWNVSSVIDVSDMFSGATAFNQPIGNWNVSNVNEFRAMFVNASSFNQDLKTWNTARFTVEPYYFSMYTSSWQPANKILWGHTGAEDLAGCQTNATHTAISKIDINYLISIGIPANNICIKNVSDLRWLFAGSSYIGNSTFNQPINTWITSHVTNMGGMFQGAGAFNQDISSWDVSNVTDMSNMFYQATVFNRDLRHWNVTKIPTLPSGFKTVSALTDANTPIWGTPGL